MKMHFITCKQCLLQNKQYLNNWTDGPREDLQQIISYNSVEWHILTPPPLSYFFNWTSLKLASKTTKEFPKTEMYLYLAFFTVTTIVWLNRTNEAQNEWLDHQLLALVTFSPSVVTYYLSLSD